MAGKKDAAWWRNYRADKARKQQESKGLQDRIAGGLHDITPILTGHPDGTVEFHEGTAPKSYSVAETALQAAKPIRLVILVDDCAACGHDRSYYHSAAGCSHPYTAGAPQSGVAGSPCVCSAFVDASEPF